MSSDDSDARKVIVDDNDGTIKYTGPWFLTDGKDYDNKGDFGKPYSNSLHGTTGEASLSYSFVGSNGRVMGTIDVDDSNSSSASNPNWECLLDGVSIPTFLPPSSTENNFVLCQWDLVPFGSHEITVNVKAQGKEFWFDQIIYLPTPDLALKNATILVSDTDVALQYGSGWQAAGITGHTSVVQGAVMTFTFFGSSLSWYGETPGDIPGEPDNPSTGFFSVDDQNPTNFTVVAKQDRRGPQTAKFSQLFFKTPPLPQGNHTLTVTNHGTIQSAPLVLSYLVVDNSELPTSPSGFPSSSAGLSSNTQSSRLDPGSGRHSGNGNSRGSSKDFPYIIGSILGALSLVLLIALILFFLIRRSKTKLGSVESANSPPPYTPPKDLSHVSRNPLSLPGAVGTQPRQDAHQTRTSNASRYNFAKRFTSISTRPNSLFTTSQLSALPTKRTSSTASSSRTYRPYFSRPWFGSSSRSSSGSSATLLNYASAPPSRKSSLGSIVDDQAMVVDLKDNEVWRSHARPPEAKIHPPTYTPG
ncbi:hypothetical protein GALMADRAFT_222445 [Galerina marginata CBS 339.88]|uniref:Uncharacterized protein n=1 Tax=Galerina marginata (strain CBS 339.88) TaxID=685588 RepID=A0A067TCG7_GALM3|nr:hypothetical protein GALMADRAFT_222445 [Galerina marginata CBS 339.88]